MTDYTVAPGVYHRTERHGYRRAIRDLVPLVNGIRQAFAEVETADLLTLSKVIEDVYAILLELQERIALEEE